MYTLRVSMPNIHFNLLFIPCYITPLPVLLPYLHPSIHLWRYGPFWALAPRSEDAFILLCLLLASSIILFPGSVTCPSGRRPPILFLVFPLVVYYDIFDEWKTNLMSLAILFYLLCAQHVSDINISIFRSLRLCWWFTTSVVLFSVRCVLELLVRAVFGDVRFAGFSLQNENKTTDVVIHQHSRKLLKMDILMSETCWAHNKWNKIASDIKLVFHSSSCIWTSAEKRTMEVSLLGYAVTCFSDKRSILKKKCQGRCLDFGDMK